MTASSSSAASAASTPSIPERIQENPTPPPVVLTGFSELNQPVSFERPIFDVDEITLDYRDDVLSFEFAALDFTAPEKQPLPLQAGGLRPGLGRPGHPRLVTFTNLDPGATPCVSRAPTTTASGTRRGWRWR